VYFALVGGQPLEPEARHIFPIAGLRPPCSLSPFPGLQGKAPKAAGSSARGLDARKRQGPSTAFPGAVMASPYHLIERLGGTALGLYGPSGQSPSVTPQ